MIANTQFAAEPKNTDQLKLGLDLKFPETVVYKFNISGECDPETLKKIARFVKSQSKQEE